MNLHALNSYQDLLKFAHIRWSSTTFTADKSGRLTENYHGAQTIYTDHDMRYVHDQYQNWIRLGRPANGRSQ